MCCKTWPYEHTMSHNGCSHTHSKLISCFASYRYRETPFWVPEKKIFLSLSTHSFCCCNRRRRGASCARPLTFAVAPDPVTLAPHLPNSTRPGQKVRHGHGHKHRHRRGVPQFRKHDKEVAVTRWHMRKAARL